MAEFPSLPIWTDAYLADCSHLSDSEHGIYFQLLMLMWRSQDCKIPDDDEWIARKLRRDANAVRTHVRPIINEFCDVGEFITQKRLQKEWRWCVEKKKKNTENANIRWNKENTKCERISERNAPIPIPIPIPNKISKNSNRGTRFALAKCPDEWVDFCKNLRPDINPLLTFDSFKDYWSAVAGAKGVKLDWFATWRNWIRNQKHGNSDNRSFTDSGKRIAEKYRRASEQEERAANLPSLPSLRPAKSVWED